MDLLTCINGCRVIRVSLMLLVCLISICILCSYTTDEVAETQMETATTNAELITQNMIILVTDFANKTGDTEYDNVGIALGIYVTDKLTRVSTIKVVTDDTRREALAEQQIGMSGFVEAESAAETGILTGATHVVFGTYTLLEDKLIAGANVVDAVSGVQLCSATYTSSCDDTDKLVCEITNQILSGLSVTLTEIESESVMTEDTGATIDTLKYRGEFERTLFDGSGKIKERFTPEEIRFLKELCSRILAIENKNSQMIAMRRFIHRLKAETALRG